MKRRQKDEKEEEINWQATYNVEVNVSSVSLSLSRPTHIPYPSVLENECLYGNHKEMPSCGGRVGSFGWTHLIQRPVIERLVIPYARDI